MSYKVLLIGILILNCLFSGTAFALSQSKACVDPEDVTLARPEPRDKPTDVRIDLFVLDIKSVNDIKQHFTADFVLALKWHDSRLVRKTEAGRKTLCQYDISEIWNPQLTILNLREVTKQLDDVAYVLTDGTVRYTQRYYARLASPLNLHLFPFDHQKIAVKIISLKYGPDELNLILDKKGTGRAEKFSIANWHISEGEAEVSTFSAQASHLPWAVEVLALFKYSFVADRSVRYYIWKVIVPIILIVGMSWAVFWVNPIKIEVQMSLSSVAILTLIAFQFSLGNLLPQIPYLTLIDYYILVCLFFVFAAFIEAACTTAIALKGHPEKALTIDRVSRWIFPLSFLVILCVFAAIAFATSLG